MILARTGSSPANLRIVFGDDRVGSFTVTAVGDDPTLSQQGVTLTGAGAWTSSDGVGTMAILTDKAPTLDDNGGASGSLGVTLTSGPSRAKVSGPWSCIKTLAGGDGWSHA